MRVVVLTGSFQTCSLYVRRLAQEPSIDVAMVVYNQGQIANPSRWRKRKFKKLLQIGPLGAINGMRIRRWFGEDLHPLLEVEDLDVVAQRHGIRFEQTPTLNCPHTVDLFKQADADIGLSLGNGYIGKRVFSTPRHGMLNIHHEVLPRFQGAQSVIWQIYEGSTQTGYTIHEIDQHIDTGRILYQETMPIQFKPTLGETVSHNYARLYLASVDGLVYTLTHYEALVAKAQPQGHGRSYTTPSFWQFLRMKRRHKHFYQAAAQRHPG